MRGKCISMVLSAFLVFGDPLPALRPSVDAYYQEFVERVYFELRLDPSLFVFTNIVLSEDDEWPVKSLDLNPVASVFGRVRIAEIRQALQRFASEHEEGRAWLNLLWNDGAHRHTVLSSEVGELLTYYLYPLVEGAVGEKTAMSLVANDGGWNVSGVRFWEGLRCRIDIASIPFPPTPSEAWLAA